MTIERTKQLLGDNVKNMTDEEIRGMIGRFSQLADVALDLLIKNAKYGNNRITTQNLRT